MHTARMTSFGAATGYVTMPGPLPLPHCYDVATRFNHKILQVRRRHYAAVSACCNIIKLCSSNKNYVNSLKSTHNPSTTTQRPKKAPASPEKNATDDIKRQSTLSSLTATATSANNDSNKLSFFPLLVPEQAHRLAQG